MDVAPQNAIACQVQASLMNVTCHDLVAEVSRCRVIPMLVANTKASGTHQLTLVSIESTATICYARHWTVAMNACTSSSHVSSCAFPGYLWGPIRTKGRPDQDMDKNRPHRLDQ